MKAEESCPHSSYHPERMGQFHTGDYICTDCGKVLTEQEIQRIEDRRRDKAN